MNLAFLLTQLEVGGAQVRVMQTAEELRRRGHTVDVIFLYKKRECFENQPKIILSPTGGIAGMFKAIVALRTLLAKGRYDVLVTNTAPANIIGNSVAALCGLNRRMACQTQPPQNLNKIYRILDKIVGSIGIYKYNIANSRWTGSCFSNYPSSYRRRLHVITNGIMPRVSEKTRAEARDSLGFGQTEKIIINIGRLSTQKGQETVLQALPLVPDAKLVIAGDGEHKAKLQDMVEALGLKERVVFTGEVSGDRIALLLRAADVFAFPSRWETFGLAVVEAAASGVPIVASDLDVLREVLTSEDGKPVAEFVPVDNHVAFASSLNAVLGNPLRMQEMSEDSQRLAKVHSMEGHVDRLLQAMNTLV